MGPEPRQTAVGQSGDVPKAQPRCSPQPLDQKTRTSRGVSHLPQAGFLKKSLNSFSLLNTSDLSEPEVP